MEFVLPDWFYQGVLDRRLVLTIDSGYFALTGGIERWLYRVARKHAGHQCRGWRFDLRHLHAKSASTARYSDFALDLRRIVARQPLPGYALALEREISTDTAARELIVMRPVGGSVDKLWTNRATIGTSGASGIGISGANLSGLRAHVVKADASKTAQSRQFSLALDPLNLLTQESNPIVVGDDPCWGQAESAAKGSGR